MIIRARDAMEINYCVSGQKKFCETHNIDFKKFVKEGVPAEEFERTGDAMALKLVNYVKEKS